jgi:hypothetical protein
LNLHTRLKTAQIAVRRLSKLSVRELINVLIAGM